jgi:hypothetical protein
MLRPANKGVKNNNGLLKEPAQMKAQATPQENSEEKK